jgi:hypothetical protein
VITLLFIALDFARIAQTMGATMAWPFYPMAGRKLKFFLGIDKIFYAPGIFFGARGSQNLPRGKFRLITAKYVLRGLGKGPLASVIKIFGNFI